MRHVADLFRPRRWWTLTEFLVLFVLVMVNGLLAGAEMATVTLRKTRLQELVEQGRESARAVTRLRAHPERFLATVQFGITVVGAAAGYGRGVYSWQNLQKIHKNRFFKSDYFQL